MAYFARYCTQLPDKNRIMIRFQPYRNLTYTEDYWCLLMDGLNKMADIVESWIGQLSQVDAKARRAAVQALGKASDTRALAALIARLKDTDDTVRWMAAEALGSIGDARAKDALMAALRDEDDGETTRWAAALSLGTIGDAHAIDSLVAVLKDEAHESVRNAAVIALQQIGDARVIQPLIDTLNDPNAGVRFEAAQALAKLNHAAGRAILLAHFRDGPLMAHRVLAAIALAHLGDDGGRAELESALTDSRWQRQHDAIRAALALLTK